METNDSQNNKYIVVYMAITVILICTAILAGYVTFEKTDPEDVISSPLTSEIYLTNQRTKKEERKIDRIIIHHTAGNFTLEELGELFDDRDRQASATYAIDTNGKVGQYVSELDEPWTSGSRKVDANAITIELVDTADVAPWKCTDKTYETLVKLMKDISNRYDIDEWVWNKNVFVHRHFVKDTICPGDDVMGNMERIIEEANKR